jgi:hypothetical protein
MQDPLRAVLDSVFAAPAYQWQERDDPFAFLRRWATALLDRIVQWGQANPAAVRVLLWAMLLLVLFLLLQAILSAIRGFRARPVSAASTPDGLLRDAAWYRREAERLAGEGRLVEAMQADFTALMLELDRDRLVRYHPSKTPQEYVREATLPEPARAELRELVWSLYRHVFGREPVTPDAVSHWRARTVADRYAPAR